MRPQDTNFITVRRSEYTLGLRPYSVHISEICVSVIINEMLFGFDLFQRVIVLSLFIKYFCEFHNLYFSPFFFRSEGSCGWDVEREVYW